MAYIPCCLFQLPASANQRKSLCFVTTCSRNHQFSLISPCLNTHQRKVNGRPATILVLQIVVSSNPLLCLKPFFMFSSFTNSVACKLSWEPKVLCQTLVNRWLFNAGGRHGSQLIMPKKKDGVKETGRKRN